MKTLRSLFAIIPFFALTQCATETAAPSAASKPAAAPAPTADGEIKPGMTKAQVIAVWNEPDSKTSLPGGGEVWKWAGQGWKRHVPVYGTWAHVEEHTVTFGADGKVVGNNTKDYGNAFQEPWRRR
jgi:hypothetical protein